MPSSLLEFVLIKQADAEVDAQARFGSDEPQVQPVEGGSQNLDCLGGSAQTSVDTGADCFQAAVAGV
ncbi:hypothetical protein CF166_13280 [Amycolatopsis sp. KNN50.9b]|nr:hypothetical protein CF166_13280 [Amycolatopsis sp. KNN50.9b]